jgi:hypothetical protein
MAFTVSAIVVLAVMVAFDESVPVTVTVYAPAVVVDVVLTLTLLIAAEFVMSIPTPAEQVGMLVGLDRFVVTAQVRFTIPT